ncbi:MAG: BTAD domain-containing putative transcriptional regulator, partial [Solirubrobacteraceae bacterium]
HGPALADLQFEPFAAAEIARLAAQRLVALEARVEADLARGSHGALVSELQQLRTEHPTRERLTAALMLALYRSGRQAEALEVYRDVRQILVEDAGIEPGADLQRAHAAILRQDPSLELQTPAVPPPRELNANRGVSVTPGSDRQSSLPAAPNRTIGRVHEVGSVAERLRAGAVRLLTLTGPGGVGKTRLALDAARGVELDFADGARFVSLAPVERPEDVPAAIVSALAITPLAGESADQAVARFLATKHLLLVVDNCEHLPGAAAFIGGLAVAGPTVTVLATSREPLAVQAEQCYPVPPLALPEPGEDPDAVADVDAVALFCERARAHDPGFDLGDGTIDAIAEICCRVDGLPLAIELAAARCGLLSPAEIATRLHGALDGLGAGSRDAPARQQTLSATIDWSHSLLDADEKACFARFAVFEGGATVQAAETITDASIDTLDRLVAKSLLVRRHVDGRTRLGMLETIRAYAVDRFAVHSDSESVRERHYRYFLALAQRHASLRALCGTNRKAHLDRLDGELANVHTALEWATNQDSAEAAVELCAAFGEYWLKRDRYADAAHWIGQALSKPGGDPAPRVRALCIEAWALWPLGRAAEQGGVMAEAQAIASALADPATLAEVLHSRASQESCQGRLDVGSKLADEALAYARETGDPWVIAMAAWASAQAADGSAELRERVDRAASLLEEAGNVDCLADLFHNAADLALCHGCDREASEFVDRATPLVRDLDHPYLWMLLQAKAGRAALLNGNTEAARHAFREQLTLCRELAVLPAASQGLAGVAAVAAVRDDLDRAARLSGAAAAHRCGEPHNAVDARLDAAFFEPARRRGGAAAWDAALGDGTALSFEDAIAYALDEPHPQAANGVSPPRTKAGQDH